MAALLLVLSCASRVPLTPSLIKEYRLSYSDLKKLQLYTSEDMLLEMETTKIDKDVDSSHSLKTVEDNYVKQIVFKRKTPCIAQTASPNKLRIAFEQGDNLSFTINKGHHKGQVYGYKPDRKFNQEKMVEKLPGSGYHNWGMIGKESYKDTTYNVFVKRDVPYLLVEKKGLRNLVIDKRAVKGIKLGD